MKDIGALVPVDRVAARVVSTVEKYSPDKKVVNHDSELPIEVRPFNKVEVKAQGFIDLRGRVVGRFVVSGITLAVMVGATIYTSQWGLP